MNLDRSLSPLEMTALGILLKRGPCLAHTVLLEFAGSATFAYRSGAGSIYPLLKRLALAGLLRVEGKNYSLTDEGVAVLRDWIRPPFGDSDIATKLDVLRSRAYFLKLLTPEQIEEFAEASLAGLKKLLEACQKTLEEQRASGDIYGEFAQLGAVRETEARISWMIELREGLRAAKRQGAQASSTFVIESKSNGNLSR